jgi:beta,beta-carotene 9',10'-dioxygenase
MFMNIKHNGIFTALGLFFCAQLVLLGNGQPPFIQGVSSISGTYLKGFDNLSQEVSVPSLPVRGQIPSWLSGTFFRNGPAKFYENDSFVDNWLDGLGMIHSYSFVNGTVSYANKFIKSSFYDFVAQTSSMAYEGFMSGKHISLAAKIKYFFKNILMQGSPNSFKQNSPNANVNIAYYDKQLVALSEIPLPIIFDQTTLETKGVMDYNDTLPHKQIWECAHPHYDSKKNEYINYFITYGRHCTYCFYSIEEGTTTRKIIASIDTQEPSYAHSFSITNNYIVFCEFPFVVNPLDLLFPTRGFINNFKWKPQRGCNFYVIDRKNGQVKGIYRTDSFFSFHHVNAYEDNDTIIIDIITYPSVEMDAVKFENILKVFKEGVSTDYANNSVLSRFTINPLLSTIDVTCLSNVPVELPQINYKQCNGSNYSYMYSASNYRKNIPFVFDSIVKINVKTGKAATWYEENCYTGEPMFVACPEQRYEDDGVILTVVLDAIAGTSFLLILDAHSFNELARAYLPHAIPFGIHGFFKINEQGK